MAADTEREAEAMEWVEEMEEDIRDGNELKSSRRDSVRLLAAKTWW